MTNYAIIFAIVLLAVMSAGWLMNAGKDFGPIEYAHDGYGG